MPETHRVMVVKPSFVSDSGSGSSSSDSGQTVRQNTKQTAPAPVERTTFTFSAKSSPFLQTSPPGSAVFTSSRRRGSDVSRDRVNRRQPGGSQPALSTSDSGWIPLRPLQPLKEISVPLFTPPLPEHVELRSNTVVFAGRSSPETATFKARPSPRLSLVAQHYHATSQHPFFDTPPQLITPPPQDPFMQLSKQDGYFPPVSSPKRFRSSIRTAEVAHKSRSSSNIATTPSNFTQPDVHPSRTKSSMPISVSTYQERAPRTHSLFLTEGKPAPLPTPTSRSTAPVSQTWFRLPPESQSATPRVTKPRAPKAITTPNQKRSSPKPQPQPSIAVFKDCFGVLAATESVFPLQTPHSHSGSGSDAGAAPIDGRGRAEFQRRWTRRWLRRTMRGVGSMSSGSGSGSSVDGPVQRSAKSTGGSSGTMFFTARCNSASGSQDSLDRVRVSRSNAGSPPNESATQTMHGTELSDVDEVGTDAERDSPDAVETKADPVTEIVGDIVADEATAELETEIPETSVPIAAMPTA